MGAGLLLLDAHREHLVADSFGRRASLSGGGHSLELLDHVHALDDLAKDGVLPVELRPRLQANVELAPVGDLFGIEEVGTAGGSDRAPDVRALDFRGDRVARPPLSGPLRIPAQDHGPLDDLVECEAVVEALPDELEEVLTVPRRVLEEELDHDSSVLRR